MALTAIKTKVGIHKKHYTCEVCGYTSEKHEEIRRSNSSVLVVADKCYFLDYSQQPP